MKYLKKIVLLNLFLLSISNYAQLGFCTGSKGEAIFSENFGNGTNFGPALATGTTTYNFVVGTPNDGNYTLYWRTYFNENWHNSLDHTPDATDGPNGKALIVNANANTSGEFYKRTVTGLCEGTTFEFSAWVMNGYNPSPPGNPGGFCGAGEIPINVRFEIWNGTDTVLLASGNTGNIFGTAMPLWQQFALVFTMPAGETSAVLRMKNNGLGGCGNDLAIDDIEFRACGDLTTVSSPTILGNEYQACQNQPNISVNLLASTVASTAYSYQWQSSTNGVLWYDIIGANTAAYTASNINSTTYYRVKAAQNVANLNNPFCSSISNNMFTVTVLDGPGNIVNDGNQTICSGEPIPTLSVTSSDPNTGVNWYNASTGGTLLQANSTSFTPTIAGTYYAQAYHLTTNCVDAVRVPVTLTISPSLSASITGTSAVCSGNTATITFNGSPNAIVNYKVDNGATQSISLNGSGTNNVTTPLLTVNSTYSLVSTSTVSGSCLTNLTASFTVTVNSPPTAAISGSISVCSGSSGTVTFTGTPADAIISYTINNGTAQTVQLVAGTKTINTANLTTNSVYTLVSVSSTGANACTQNLTSSTPHTISVIQLPTATMSANPLSVCLGETSTLTFTGTPNAEIAYREVGASQSTITLNSAGTATIATVPISSTTTYQLVNATASSALNCTQPLSGSVVISLNPTPTVSFTGSLDYCQNEPVSISLFSDIVGTTFNWTVSQNGTTGAIAGNGSQIDQLIGLVDNSDGFVTYTVTPTFNGCDGNPIVINVAIHPRPIPNIVDGTICVNSSNVITSEPYTLTTNLNPSTNSFNWFFEGNPILNAFGSTYDATAIGVYTVIATNTLTGCVSLPVHANVIESQQGESLIIDQSATFSDNPTITVTVIGNGGPFLYQIDDSNFQSSNVFYNVSTGVHTITVIDEVRCTNLTQTVTIINYPKFFTPNGDGINDTWNINSVEETATIVIFDRYGKLIKQLKPGSAGWDGTYNGNPQFASDYWFSIDFYENGVEKTFKAHFTLKR